MAKLYGWAGKILKVDLTNETVNVTPTKEYGPEDFIGGVGLSAKIFWELGCLKVDSLAPDNPLIISAGPLTGIYGPFGRGEVCSIAPQCYPNELFTYSGFGGRFPSEMKYAGYDGIVITGKAIRPVYISIHDEDVKVKDARELWSMDTFEAQERILSCEPETTIMVIGPAGENLSRIAVILNEIECAAGQGGFGAVMGSKNLKAIAIKGAGSIAVAKPDKLMELTKIIIEENQKSFIGLAFRYPLLGSRELRDLFAEKYYIKPYGCYGCPQQCRGINDVPGIGRGGASCVNWGWTPIYSNEPENIWEANILCQKLGINSFEIIQGIPFLLLHSFERGILTSKEIQDDIGLPTPRWLGGTDTDHEFIRVFLHKVANGESPYAEGTARFVDYFKKKLASGEKLMALYQEQSPTHGYAYHFTENLGGALHWATDTRDPFNSCHDYFDYGYAGSDIKIHKEAMEHFGLPIFDSYQILDLSKTIYEGVERVTAWVQDNQCLKNSLPICEFFSFPTGFYNSPETDLRIFESKLLSVVTGININTDGVAKAGERIVNLLRAIMVKRENRSRDDDTLNEPFFKRAIQCAFGAAGPIDRAEFEALKDRYYEVRGWNIKTGRPTRAKFEELGLKDVADELASIDRLH